MLTMFAELQSFPNIHDLSQRHEECHGNALNKVLHGVTVLTIIICIRVTVLLRLKCQEDDEVCLGEAHDEDDKDCTEPGQILHHHSVDHCNHRSNLEHE